MDEDARVAYAECDECGATYESEEDLKRALFFGALSVGESVGDAGEIAENEDHCPRCGAELPRVW